MEVQVSQEGSVFSTSTLDTGALSRSDVLTNNIDDLTSSELNQPSVHDGETSLSEASAPSHEYELNQSESLRFLYDLLYDEESNLSKSDILSILESLKKRERSLPFSFTNARGLDVQGIKWPSYLRDKFSRERARVGNKKWFHNVPGSREEAFKNVNIKSFQYKTDFFQFYRFFSKLKIHITHFQLRNLICCGPNLSNGIFYPSSYLHDHNLQTVDYSEMDSQDSYHNFFKINRLMQDEQCITHPSMKLDCLIDSRNLLRNSNSRISTMTCSESLLASGTFEGGYLLQDISDPNDSKFIGEFCLTNNADGITNHIVINDNEQLIISSNDQYLRLVDLEKFSTDSTMLPFAVNCVALNPNNKNEIFVTGDNINSFIMDTREKLGNKSSKNVDEFRGHKDFGFSCDWSRGNDNLLLTGNQDGCVRLWDKRFCESSLYSWNGTLGSSVSNTLNNAGGPVRNTKFSHTGEFICWAESLDHIGILQVDDLIKTDTPKLKSRVQSVEFIGKCIGLNFVPSDSGHGENLIVGINDCPLGGILNYKLDSRAKPLDFDFCF